MANNFNDIVINLTNDDLDRIRSVNSLELFNLTRNRLPNNISILAEGDSWLAYPKRYIVFGGKSNIVEWLKDRRNLNITDISSNGDEALQMITGDAKLEFLELVSSRNYDIILFSAGGNDIAGRYDFEFFLKNKEAGMSWRDCIEDERLSRRLDMIRNAYIDLIELVEFACVKAGKPVPIIITHTYDVAIPSDDGAVFLWGVFQVDGGRSWMHPYLMKAGITNSEDQRKIVKFVLEQFKNILLELSANFPDSKFRVVDTHGTLLEDEWLNEIHPTSDGFKKIADKIYNEGIVPAVQQLRA